MSEYVSKEELKEFFESIEITVTGRTRAKAIGEVLQAIYNGVMELHTTDAEPVRHGNWIVWDEILAGIYHTVSECSECGFTTDKMFREEMLYCPNCGARMDEE